MSNVRRFEDLEVFQLARQFVKHIYALSERGRFSRDFVLRDQIRRAALSIMSNIAEGFERGGDREFLNFLSISKGSCGEARGQLYAAFDRDYVTKGEFDDLSDEALRISGALASLMRYLRRSELRGSKFKEVESAPG